MAALGYAGEHAHLKAITAATNPPAHRPDSHPQARALGSLLQSRNTFSFSYASFSQQPLACFSVFLLLTGVNLQHKHQRR